MYTCMYVCMCVYITMTHTSQGWWFIAVFAEVLGQNFSHVLHPHSLVDKLKSLASNRLVHCKDVLTKNSEKSVS
jgi:hypothetical protein